MAGLAAAASIFNVIQISGQVFDLCRTYYSGVKDARDDIRRLRSEVMSLQDVLIHLQDLADCPKPPKSLDLLNAPDGPLQQCQVELERLVAKLEPAKDKVAMKQFGLRALKWPFSSKDINKTIEMMQRHSTNFNLALTQDIQ